MPELPEVETVRRQLTSQLIGKTFLEPIVYYSGMIKTPINEYVSGLTGRKVTSIDRKGKFLIFNLDNDYRIIFHLRMEGKLFIVDKNNHSPSHLSLFIPFENDNNGLAFYDVRKFGVTYYLPKDDEGPLEKLGKEPFDIDDPKYLLSHYQKTNKPIKEMLLDQTIMSGLGNIYADEVCFACRISPFMKANQLTEKNCEDILTNSRLILNKSIENQGSTVRSYKASAHVSGSFQNFLKVYSQDGKECSVCHKVKIEKRKLSGRGTSYCPYCQKTGISLGITGKIASGKSQVTKYFKDEGYVTFSADECVHELYSNPLFLKELEKEFPMIFSPSLDKRIISDLLINDSVFKRKYETFIHSKVKEKANQFIIENDGKNKALEIPLLFKAKMENFFTYIIGCETNNQIEHLLQRGEKEIEKKLAFNNLNNYDKNRHKLDYIIKTDSTLEDLRSKVKSIVADINNKTK
ncbi:MAG: DNA-formamidopyrimidine glycosylase [Bacilli bacterium]